MSIPIPTSISASSSGSSSGSDSISSSDSASTSTDQARDPSNASRTQQAGNAANRVNPKSIPRSGITPPTTAPLTRAGTGSIGNDARPFKVK